MKLQSAALILAIAAAPGLAAAADHDPGVNHRQHRQQVRIQEGVKSGDLTAGETARVRAEQRHVRREERRYKADGELTAAERADLHQDLNAASRDIHRQKHDDQTRSQ